MQALFKIATGATGYYVNTQVRWVHLQAIGTMPKIKLLVGVAPDPPIYWRRRGKLFTVSGRIDP